MQRQGLAFLYCVLTGLIFAVGCSSSESTTTAETPPDPNTWSESELSAAKEQVEQTVSKFFTGLQTGDAKLVDAALTKKARENNLVKAESPRQATFKIARVEIKPQKQDKLAYAATEWTFLDQGQEIGRDEAVWALRLEPEGWRIAGSIMKVPELEGQGVALDFENKQECERTMQAMDEEIAKRRAAAAGQEEETAAVPPDPSKTERR